MANSKDSGCKVWAKGDACMSPYSGDDKLYKAVIEKIHRSPTGHLTATVKYRGYGDEEEVDVARLQMVKVKDNEGVGKKSRQRETAGMFKPLTGGEADERLSEKYGGLEEQTLIKSEKLSATIFSTKKSPLTTRPKTNNSQEKENSQGKNRKKGIVAIGGEAISGSRLVSPVTGKKVNAKSTCTRIDLTPDSDTDDDSHDDVKTMRKRKVKGVVVTGGEALDETKELPTSKRLSDISSILDCRTVHEALNKRSRTTAPDMSDENMTTNGFDEDDLEKPKFNFKPEGAKVPFILSEKGQEPIIQVPATINQHLRDYQREGIKFLYSHYIYNRGAILGDDMGLGKTVQVIGFLAALLGKQGNRVDVMRQKPQFIRKLSDSSAVREDTRVTDPFLIIGPGCVLYNWLEELETWGYFTVRKFHGTSKNECLCDIKKGKVEIVVTTFETFREHQGVLNKIDWAAVIADEVHKIKGLKAQTTKALRTINTRRRYGLTGTALQNNLLELWSILDWAQPGCLGRQTDFQEEYVQHIELGQRHDANKRELAEARKKKERFAEIRKGMMIRRMKTLIAEQLPKKDDNVVFCRLSQLQTSIYQTILDHPDMDLILHMDDPCGCDSGVPQGKCCKKKTADGHSVKALMFTFMYLLLKVSNHVAMLIPNNNTSEQQSRMARKICDVAFEKHPGFISQTREASFQTLSDPKYCGKMKILQGLLKVFYKDHSQVLVFSYSTQALDIIEQYLMSTGYEFRRIDGSVSAKKRQIIVREFNTDPSIFVCLISTKAGGLGLNLTGANRVIIFDPNWNPTHDLQAQDRAYRIGQRRNVQVYRLVSAGTIEENMYLRQIYKQQLLNVSVEDENARRYFYAVQGNRRQKGELFGVKNMFQLHTGNSCLTVDILKRNERVESALAGFEMTKYVPPVVRLEEDEDLDDVIMPLRDEDQLESEEAEDVFAQFFSSQETNDESDELMDDEIDGDNSDTGVRSSDDFSDSSDDLLSKPTKTETKKSQKNIKKTLKKNIHLDISEENDVLDDDKYQNEDDTASDKQSLNIKKRKTTVTFKTPKPYKTDQAQRGKVTPSQSRTGKGPVKKGKRDHANKDDGDEGAFRVDQTLAGSFTDVGDVFENCGVVHIHENVKVVGGSRAEDHMSKCAITDVYELHQNSQDLAVQCDPLSESSEEDTPPTVNKKGSAEDHNTCRSTVVDNMKVLIGQTPRGIRLKQFQKIGPENQSGNLTDFAEMVLSLTTEERIELLNKYYANRDPKLKNILTGPQLPEKQEPEKSRKYQGREPKRKKPADKRRGRTRTQNIDQSLGGILYEDLSDSESLSQPRSTLDKGTYSDEGSDMDIGVKVSPVKKRKMLNQSWSKQRKRTPRKQTEHVQIPPSYLDYPDSHENDNSDTNVRVSNQSASKRNNLKDKPDLKSMISENQLECIDSFADDDSVDSSDLLNQMAKMSQVNVKVNVDGEETESEVTYRKYEDKNRNTYQLSFSANNAKNGSSKRTYNGDRGNVNRKSERIDCDNQRYTGSPVEHTEHKSTRRNMKSDAQIEKQNSRVARGTEAKSSVAVNDGANSQVSVLDDLFDRPGKEVKYKRKPAPSKGKTASDLNNTRKVKVEKSDTQSSEKGESQFKAVDEIFCSTDSDSEVHLETSTLKDDDYDCFDDPRKWKRRKRKPDKQEMSAVDKLISDSEADFNNLFAAGKMKKKEGTRVKIEESSPVKTYDRSASLFSF